MTRTIRKAIQQKPEKLTPRDLTAEEVRSRAKRAKYFFRTLIFAALLLLITLSALAGLRFYIQSSLRNSMTPKEYTEMRRFFDQPLNFPKEWGEPEPFSEDLVAAAENLLDVMEGEWEKKAQLLVPDRIETAAGTVRRRSINPPTLLQVLQSGETLTQEEWTAAEAVLRSSSRFVEAHVEFAAHPDYEMETLALLNSALNHDHYWPNYEPMCSAARILCLRAHSLTRQNDWEGAFDSLLQVLRMAKRHPASDLVTHYLGITFEQNAVRSLAVLLNECDDPNTLRFLLNEINRLDAVLHQDSLAPEHSAIALSGLRLTKIIDDYDFDMAPGKPRAYYWRQFWHKGAPRAHQTTKPEFLIRIHERVPPYLPDFLMDANFFMGGGNPFARICCLDEIVYSRFIADLIDSHIHEKAMKAEFDLVRLQIALLLNEEQPEIAPDPFTAGAYQWDASSEAYFSMGPDKANDGNGTLYNPTNGIISPGDISHPQPAGRHSLFLFLYKNWPRIVREGGW